MQVCPSAKEGAHDEAGRSIENLFLTRKRFLTLIAKKLRYPTGARPLLVEETARRRCIEARFVSLLESGGFAEVVLPIIDFADPYGDLAGSDTARHSYRFTDRDGELVALRSDFTPMVARALAPSLDAARLPLRVFYRGDVVRCEPTRLGSNRELFQIGAELIGDPSADGDLEMLRLAASLVSDPLVVYSAGAEYASLDGRFVFHGDEDARTGYYTGLRFWVYGADRRTPIAQGGRYDALYARFGRGAAAIGFTFTIDLLED